MALIFDDRNNELTCTISSGTKDPITGSKPAFSSATLQKPGKNLLFEPIPMEMLYTNS